MYGKNDEFLIHVFLTCKEVNPIWMVIDNWIGVHSVHQSIVKEHFLGFQLINFIRNYNLVWRIV